MIKMKTKKSITLLLTDFEKANLKQNKIKIAAILDYACDELKVLLNISDDRAQEIHALAEFQTVPSIGIKSAEDLVFLGYFSLSELKNKDGAALTDDYELKKGYWTDPCMEDQFRLVVHYAKTRDNTKRWWDFTEERKKYRIDHGYPIDRPKNGWQSERVMESANFPKRNCRSW